MIAWWPARPKPKPPTPKTSEERAAFRTSICRIGSHIRGRVIGPEQRGRGYSGPIWRVEVYSTKTGAVLQWDNAYTLEDALNDAHEHASIARLAYFYGFARRAAR